MGRTVQPILMQFEAFGVGNHPVLDVYKPEVPTIITFQHYVSENRKWCVFHIHPSLYTAWRNAARKGARTSEMKLKGNRTSPETVLKQI
jgi:hypothetical protein